MWSPPSAPASPPKHLLLRGMPHSFFLKGCIAANPVASCQRRISFGTCAVSTCHSMIVNSKPSHGGCKVGLRLKLLLAMLV